MPLLRCCLLGHSGLRIAWDDALHPAMAGLQALIGGSLQPENGPADFLLHSTEDSHRGGLEYDEAQQCFCRWIDATAGSRRRIGLWRAAVICAAGSRFLRGEYLCLMHGCLLKLSTGEGILLCGQSGMGKSTTAARWQAVGGISTADDMVLVEWKDEAVYAHPLPTWSRCFESVENEWYPFEEPLRISCLLALSRDENAEEIRATEPFKFLTVLYASCCFFNMELAKYLPAEPQRRFIHAVQESAKHLYGIFSPRALFANLQGDLKKTLSILK